MLNLYSVIVMSFLLSVELYANPLAQLREDLLSNRSQIYYDPSSVDDLVARLLQILEKPAELEFNLRGDSSSFAGERIAIRHALLLLVDAAEMDAVAGDERKTIKCIYFAFALSLSAMNAQSQMYLSIPAMLCTHMDRWFTLIARLSTESKELLASSLKQLTAVEKPSVVRLREIKKLEIVATDVALAQRYHMERFGVPLDDGTDTETFQSQIRLLCEGYEKITYAYSSAYDFNIEPERRAKEIYGKISSDISDPWVQERLESQCRYESMIADSFKEMRSWLALTYVVCVHYPTPPENDPGFLYYPVFTRKSRTAVEFLVPEVFWQAKDGEPMVLRIVVKSQPVPPGAQQWLPPTSCEPNAGSVSQELQTSTAPKREAD